MRNVNIGHLIRTGFEWFLIYVIVRGIFVRLLAEKVQNFGIAVGQWTFKRLVKTEKDMALWLHYRNKALNKYHKD